MSMNEDRFAGPLRTWVAVSNKDLDAPLVT